MRLVKVARNEMTCLGCGEIAIGGYCPNCGGDNLAEAAMFGDFRSDPPPLVPTTSYLRDGEYYLAA